MIRVVVHANVLVSAALARDPRAPSVLALDAVIDERLELILSPTLLAEITSVLGRPRLRRYVSEADATRFVEDLAALPRARLMRRRRIPPSAAIRTTTTSSLSPATPTRSDRHRRP